MVMNWDFFSWGSSGFEKGRRWFVLYRSNILYLSSRLERSNSNEPIFVLCQITFFNLNRIRPMPLHPAFPVTCWSDPNGLTNFYPFAKLLPT